MDLFRRTNPPALSKPTGYTHVVEVNRGKTVYIAGQVAFDASGAVVGKQDFIAQTRQVMENLKAALAAAGATFENVVKVVIHFPDSITEDSLVTTEIAYRLVEISYFPANLFLTFL